MPNSAGSAVVRRDAQADGEFVYAVRTTGVYCRPSCPSRAAKRQNVELFVSPGLAVAAGYRPCKRCLPDMPSLLQTRNAMVSQACQAIEHSASAPTLAQLAQQAGMSPYHFHHIFKAAIDLTPKAFHKAVQARRVAASPQSAQSVTTARHDALAGAVYKDSPLVGRRHAVSAGIAASWIFSESLRRVEVEE